MQEPRDDAAYPPAATGSLQAVPKQASTHAGQDAMSPMLAPHLSRLSFAHWPAADAYNAFFQQASALTHSGHPLRFVAQQQLTDTLGYEQRIYETGVVATRERNWHDLFNALVWSAFPQAKSAINARHYGELRRARANPNKRTRVQDALTLLDESGVIVASDAPELLALIRAMRWKELFWRRRAETTARMCFVLFGHGLCEQALRPYIGLTGKALLIAVEPPLLAASAAQRLRLLDAAIAARCDEVTLAPSALHPLPILGVPGWWPENEREDFYNNAAYFRGSRTRLSTANAAAAR
jgi:Protein of unknown function (DUF3025)